MRLRLFPSQWEIVDKLKMFAVGVGEEIERKDYLKNIPREKLVGLIYALAIGFKRNSQI